MNKKVAVVSGGSSGIGREIALLLSEKGYTVYELSRSGTSHDGILHIDCDVAHPSSVKNAVLKIVRQAKQIDILISNAGMGISGAVEFTEENDAKRIFDVNFFGCFYLLKEIIPLMRTQQSGRIINISSVAADIAIPFQAFYSASKAAVSSLTFALRNEVKSFGVDVTAILPGDVATGFTGARKKEHIGNDLYGGRINRSVSVMERDEQNGMTSRYAAKKVVRIAEKRSLKPKYAVGPKYKLFLLLFKLLPARLIGFVVRFLYAR